MTTRRPLGTGPSTTTSIPATSGGRRLAVERVEHEHQEFREEQEHGTVERPSGRRPLGKGAGAGEQPGQAVAPRGGWTVG